MTAIQIAARALLALLLAYGVMAARPESALALEASDFDIEMGFPYAAFDKIEDATVISVGSSQLTIGLVPGAEFKVSHDDLIAWVRQSAEDVAAYYGKFPVPSARILLAGVDGEAVQSGTTWGYRGAAARIMVGREVAAATLMREDWVMVHEMIHMALPDLGERHTWLSEGLAVYVESMARVQRGHLPAERIWQDFVRAMPKGLPQAGDQGLDNTHRWGRTYWGGAMFCLLADVEIRKKTSNRVGLQTALRAINARTNHTEDGRIGNVLALGDGATGVTVLADLYKQMKDDAVSPDLDVLWRELGVPAGRTSVAFDDSAPLAEIRQAITQPF